MKDRVENQLNKWRYQDTPAWAICEALQAIAVAIMYLASVVEKGRRDDA